MEEGEMVGTVGVVQKKMVAVGVVVVRFSLVL
jgi:hypothetical protein